MTQLEEIRRSASACDVARATWAAGNWDTFSNKLAPVGALVLERSALRPGMTLLDVGTGSGGNVAIPAAAQGATVVGLDITPELLVHARVRAERAGVEVDWTEGDAQELPFPAGRFDRVASTFGAMFAPDHRRAAAELVRVCAPRGRVLMTTWPDDGFAGQLFELVAAFLPAAQNGAEPPSRWGSRDHIEEVFGAVGARPLLTRETVFFRFRSVDDAVRRYADEFGPFVTARATLEGEDRWDAFLEAFGEVVSRFGASTANGLSIKAEYLLITVDRGWVRPVEGDEFSTATVENHRNKRTKETDMALQLGDTAPDFEADSTEGTIHFHDWIGDSWAVLFSHPKDFTPVCTTELGYMARIKPEFDRRGVKIVGLSVDPSTDHERWARDIEETQGTAPNYPIIADSDFQVSKLYGMLAADVSGDPSARTPADNQTVRNVFVIGPDKTIKLILVYPMSTGRNFDEVLRVIDSLQLTAKHKVSTPVNWKQGEDVIISGAVSNEQAKEIFGEWQEPKPYIRIVPQPN
jgi:alkyl hydroperoxide reductase subunit AhpC/SAM-dependent methyltransferase